MLKVLGEYLMRGWPQAVLVITALTVLSLFLMPLAFVLSGAPIGLLTLRRGPVAGMQVIAGVGAALALLSVLAGAGPLLAVAYAASVWLPVWVCAAVLRRTESQAAAVLAAAVIAAIFVAAMHIAVADVSGWWRAWVDGWLAQALPPGEAARYAQVVDAAAPILNALMAVATMLNMLASLLLARAWQAKLFNPGGFRREFHALRLPRGLVAPLAGAGIAVMLLEGPGMQVARDLLVVGLFAFLFHGVAAVHRAVAARGLHAGWLAGMYILMLLLPQMMLFVACIGIADALLDRRGQAGAA